MSALITSIRLIVRIGLLAVLLLALGFVIFAAMVKSNRHTTGQMADGIVALTGGKARISEAVRLLAEGKANRMLITGVNPKTTKDQLKRLVTQGHDLFACCIDLGREAEDTTGNAIETREWAELHSYKSLIIVTSNYHMPRTLLELRNAMPDIKLMPHTVEPRSFRAARWWTNRRVLRLMASEYVKYLSALLRHIAARAGLPVEAGRAFFASMLH